MTAVGVGVGLKFKAPNAPILAAPILPDDDWIFGQLTATGAGGRTLTNLGGAIGTWSITDPSGKFTIDTSTGVVTPTGALGAGPYSVTIGATNGGGSDSATVVITTSGNDADGYDIATARSVASLTELNAAVTALGTPASLAGARAIMVRGGVVPGTESSQFTMSSKAWANRVTIKRHANENNPHFYSGIFTSVVDRLRLDYITASTASSATAAVIHFQGVSAYPEVLNCTVFCRTSLDTSNNGSQSVSRGINFHGGGTYVDAKVNNNTIYDVEYGLLINPLGNSEIRGNLIGPFLNDGMQIGQKNGATGLRIEDNTIQGPTGGSGGLHCDGVQLLSTVANTEDWSGLTFLRNFFIDKYSTAASQGFFLSAAAWAVNFRPSGVVTGTDTITKTSHGFSANQQVIADSNGGTLPAPLVHGNRYYVLVVDANNFQLSLTSGGAAIDLTTAGTESGSNGFNLRSGYYLLNADIRGNVVISDSSTSNGMLINNAKGCTVRSNTIVYPSFATTGSASIFVGTTLDGGGNDVDYNLTSGTINVGSSTVVGANNVNIGPVTAANYTLAQMFDGPTFLPQNRADVLTMYNLKAGNPAGTTLAGAIGTGLVNFATTTPGSDGSFNSPWPPAAANSNGEFGAGAYRSYYRGFSYG